MSEAHDVATRIYATPQTFDEATRIVRTLMPDESVQFVDNIAWELYQIARAKNHDVAGRSG